MKVLWENERREAKKFSWHASCMFVVVRKAEGLGTERRSLKPLPRSRNNLFVFTELNEDLPTDDICRQETLDAQKYSHTGFDLHGVSLNHGCAVLEGLYFSLTHQKHYPRRYWWHRNFNGSIHRVRSQCPIIVVFIPYSRPTPLARTRRGLLPKAQKSGKDSEAEFAVPNNVHKR